MHPTRIDFELCRSHWLQQACVWLKLCMMCTDANSLTHSCTHLGVGVDELAITFLIHARVRSPLSPHSMKAAVAFTADSARKKPAMTGSLPCLVPLPRNMTTWGVGTRPATFKVQLCVLGSRS
jgi:hypothetical protein